jgi:hypothetical protein
MGRARIDALLRHVNGGHELQDFAGTRYERLALVQTACKLKLVKWQEERGRYELTAIGRLHVIPKRFGSRSLIVTTAVGATIGAVALAVLWLPTDPLSRRVGDQATSLIAAPVSRLADAGVREPVTAQTTTPARDAAPAVPGSGPTAAATSVDAPAAVGDPPVSEQPSAQTAPTALKQAPAKTSQRTTGRAPSTRNFANAYRDERYAGPGPIVR